MAPTQTSLKGLQQAHLTRILSMVTSNILVISVNMKPTNWIDLRLTRNLNMKVSDILAANVSFILQQEVISKHINKQDMKDLDIHVASANIWQNIIMI